MTKTPVAKSRSFDLYLSEINAYDLLTVADEQRLARSFRQEGDTRAAHQLVTANLRFVVKIAYEYRSYGFSIAELVQEGNLGLMKAVEKFDPEKGIRLISYAVWWIRAFIQNYVLKSWSLVKLGTTQAQRKLFFSLARTRRELERASAQHGTSSEDEGEDLSKIARKLGVKPGEVAEMSHRMTGRDFSLDVPVGEDGSATHLDLVAARGPTQEDALSTAQQRTMLQSRISVALGRLDPRERHIIEMRVMNDAPMTLSQLGAHFGFSRERARQLELRAKEKLKQELRGLPAQLDQPMAA